MSHFSSYVCVYIYIYLFILNQIFFLKEIKEFDERLRNVTFINPFNQCTHSCQLTNINDYMKVPSLQVIGHRKE
jgi:hypothetical protein